MRLDRHRVMKPSLRRGAALAAVLAAAMLVLGAALAAAAPTQSSRTTSNAPPGTLIAISPLWVFDNRGTNARITAAAYSTTEYYSSTSLNNGYAYVEVKTTAELNAMASPPPNPFTVTADVTMTNDEGETASATVTLETHYARNPTPATTPPAPATAPTFQRADEAYNAPPGVLISVTAGGQFGAFANAGTNPRIIKAVFEDTAAEYYTTHTVANNKAWVQAKSSAELNALASPPESPFTVTAEVTMTNDEGQEASGTVTFKTGYARNPTPATTPAPAPTLSATLGAISVAPGTEVGTSAADVFDNAGTNPRFLSVSFSTFDYYTSNSRIDDNGRLWIEAKTAAQLNALASPPESPFTVAVTVTMLNDALQSATGTLSFETTYDRNPTPATTPASDPPAQPTLSSTAGLQAAAPGTLVTLSAADVFDNAGTNPVFTNAVFSTTAYYDVSRIGEGRLLVQAKSAEDLSALSPAPDSPFTVTVTVTMRNDEAQTATGQLTFGTSYTRPHSGPVVPSLDEPLGPGEAGQSD